MTQRVVVYRVPVATYKSAHQQQQCGLRLVEIGDELVHDVERIAGFDHDLRLCMPGFR